MGRDIPTASVQFPVVHLPLIVARTFVVAWLSGEGRVRPRTNNLCCLALFSLVLDQVSAVIDTDTPRFHRLGDFLDQADSE